MRYSITILILLFAFLGCQNKEDQSIHDAKVAEAAKAELLAELKTKEKIRIEKEAKKNDKLSKIGISINNGSITLDTNKTKTFFQNIGKTIENKLNTFSKDINKGIIDGQNTGVEINNNNINIDLNKTKDFLNSWTKQMQEFAKGIDAIAKEFGTDLDKTNNTRK